MALKGMGSSLTVALPYVRRLEIIFRFLSCAVAYTLLLLSSCLLFLFDIPMTALLDLVHKSKCQ